MSFDPIAYAVSKPKVIILDSYIDGSKDPIGKGLFMLIGLGGGEHIFKGGNIAQFWKDVKTNRDLDFVINSNNTEIFVRMTKVMTPTGYEQITATVSFLVGGTVATANVVFYCSAEDEISLYVNVT